MEKPSINTISYGLSTYPLRIGTIAIPCFILSTKQSVLLKSGIQKALGYEGRSDHWLLDILNHIHKFVPVNGLSEHLQHPILFEIAGPDKLLFTAEGILPKTFLDICRAIAMAKKEGFLNVNQLKFSKSAEAILDNLSESNIDDLIDEATGFRFFRETSINILQQYLLESFNDSAVLWTKTLPHYFFLSLFETHGFDWPDLKNNPQHIAKVIHEIIYSRIPDDLLLTLRSNKPVRSYKRKGNKPQEVEHPELKIYISNVLALLKAAGNNWNIFIQLLNRSYPKNSSFPAKFPLTPTPAKNEILSSFNKDLFRMS